MNRLFIWQTILCVVLNVKAENTNLNLDLNNWRIYEDNNYKYYVYITDHVENENKDKKTQVENDEELYKSPKDLNELIKLAKDEELKEERRAFETISDKDFGSDYVDIDIFEKHDKQPDVHTFSFFRFGGDNVSRKVIENDGFLNDIRLYSKLLSDNEIKDKLILRKNRLGSKFHPSKVAAYKEWKEKIREERERIKKENFVHEQHRKRLEYIDRFLTMDRPRAMSFVTYEIRRIERMREVQDELRKMIRVLEKPRFAAVKAATLKCFRKYKDSLHRPIRNWDRPTNNLVINHVKDTQNDGAGLK